MGLPLSGCVEVQLYPICMAFSGAAVPLSVGPVEAQRYPPPVGRVKITQYHIEGCGDVDLSAAWAR